MNLITLISLLIAGCKKYPEDEHRSLKSPSKRILGTWKVTKYEVDGIDSTSSVLTVYGYSYLMFTNEKPGSYRTYLYGKACDTCEPRYLTSYTLIKPKLNGFSVGPIYGQSGTDWNILKLTKTEMKITTYSYSSNRSYSIDMQK